MGYVKSEGGRVHGHIQQVTQLFHLESLLHRLTPNVQYGSSHKWEILTSFLYYGRKCSQVMHLFYSHLL